MPFLRSHCSLNAERVPLRASPSRCESTLGKRVCSPHLCPSLPKHAWTVCPEHRGAHVDILYLPPACHAAIFSVHSPVAPGLQSKNGNDPQRRAFTSEAQRACISQFQYLNVDSRDLPLFWQRATFTFRYRLVLGSRA